MSITLCVWLTWFGVCLFTQIIGIDATNAYEEKCTADAIRNHITRIREHNSYKDIHICIAAENDYGGGPYAGWLMQIARRAGGTRVFPFYGDSKKDKPGFHTDKDNKPAAIHCLNNLLRARKLFLAHERSFISEDVKGNVQKLFNQMQMFSVVPKESKSLHAGPGETYTGKLNGNKDDVIVSTFLNILTAEMVQEQTAFQQYCRMYQIQCP